jgi:hypothetical protein
MRSPRSAVLLLSLLIAVALFAVPLAAGLAGRGAQSPDLTGAGTTGEDADAEGEEAEEGEEAFDPDAEVEGRGKRGETVEADVRDADPGTGVAAPAVPAAGGFADQTRLGFTSGDQWEPAIAADRFGHVYVLYAQYGGVPGCEACLSPTQILTTSADGGSTWSAPRPIQAPGERGWDSQVAVDPVDGRTVWAAWLEKDKSDIVVARSDDFGATWRSKVVDDTNAGTDKPIIAVRGDDVYVAYDQVQTIWVSATHDGGATWTSVKAQTTGKGKLGWSLPGGGTVTPDGTVVFGWAGYERNGGAKGPVNLYVSRSTDGGATWQDVPVETSGSPPDCSADLCGWAFLGAQLTIASDDAGTVYGLWNAGAQSDKGLPERIFLARSIDGGATWSARRDVSTAPTGTQHAFPAIAASGQGRLRIAWMDNRGGNGSLWNVWSRSSTDGGATLSPEADISNGGTGVPYVTPAGFEFPFGDYFEVDVDGNGKAHAVFGEGQNYDSPGSIWYTRN